MCDTEDVRILKGVVSKKHVHMLVEYPPKLSLSNLVKRLKRRGSRRLQDEFPELKKLGSSFLGNWFWSLVDWKYNGSNGARIFGAP